MMSSTNAAMAPYRQSPARRKKISMTATRSAGSNIRSAMRPNIVKTGTIKIPLAIPSTPPSMLVPSATANSHSSRPMHRS